MKRIEYFISIPEAERIFGKTHSVSTHDFAGFYRLIEMACGPTNQYSNNSLNIEEIADFIKNMEECEQKVIKLRFFDCHTFREIGKTICMSAERIRQIQKKILDKISKRFSAKALNELTKGKEEFKQLLRERREYESNLSIDILHLSERCSNALYHAKINTIGVLLTKSDKDLLNIRNLGEACIEEIDQSLQDCLGAKRSVADLDKMKQQLHELLSQNRQWEFSQNIELLEFSARTQNALKRAGIETIGKLLTKSDKELLEIRNLGEVCILEIDDKLNQYFHVRRSKENMVEIRERFTKLLLSGRQGECEESIDILSLSLRPHKVLKRNKIETLGQLLSMDRKQLLKLKGLGLASVEEIRKKLYEVLEYRDFAMETIEEMSLKDNKKQEGKEEYENILGLPKHIEDCLKEHNICTIVEVLGLSCEELLKMSKLSKKDILIIMEKQKKFAASN